MTFLGIVACQVGTALALRTQTASLRAVGFTSNPLLLWGVAFEIVFAIALVGIAPLATMFALVLPTPAQVAALLLYPLIVWGADELRKTRLRRVGVG